MRKLELLQVVENKFLILILILTVGHSIIYWNLKFQISTPS